MKRYALFVMDAYYPGGGWSDMRGLYDTQEEALEAAAKAKGDGYEVVDLVEGKEIEVRPIKDKGK